MNYKKYSQILNNYNNIYNKNNPNNYVFYLKTKEQHLNKQKIAIKN